MITSTLGTLLMGFAVLTGVVENPPEDLLSLGGTEQALKSLNAGQTEAELINILGGVKSDEGPDLKKLEAAVKLLREGNSKERREAKEILNNAGRDALPFLKELTDDADPEVSETAKNIIEKNNIAVEKAKNSGVTPETLKLLAIRRLTELKATAALPAIKELTKSKDYDIAREAKRAVSLLEGNKPARLKRGEATLKALELIPEKSGFAVILDATEPEKAMSIEGYLKDMGNVPIPGFNMGMITGQYYKVVPEVVSMIGNPQIDAISMSSAEEVGPDSGWVGLVFIGSYDVKKMKKILEKELEPREFNGHKYFADKWGPAVYPVDEHTLIITVGPNEVKHMEPFIKKLAAKKVPEKFAELKDTSKIRLMGLGDFTKEQRDMMKKEFQKELQWIQNRKRQRGDTEAEKALVELGILFADTSKIKVVYLDKVITLTGELPDEEKAKKLIAKLDEADEKIRKIVGGMLAQLIDTKKSFAKGTIEGNKINVKVRGDLFGSTVLMPLMFLGNMRVDQARPPQIQAIEVQQAVEEAKDAAEEEVKEAEEK